MKEKHHDIEDVITRLDAMEQKARQSYVWELALRFAAAMAVAVAIPWATHTHSRLTENSSRLTVIESNRFTIQDALAMEQRIVNRPLPKWVEDMLKRLTADITDVKQDLREIRKELKK